MLTTEKKNTATPPLENVGKRIGEIYQNDISKNFENQADLLEVLMGETELLHLAYTASIDFSLDERTHAAFHRHFHTIMHLQHEFSKTIIRA